MPNYSNQQERKFMSSDRSDHAMSKKITFEVIDLYCHIFTSNQQKKTSSIGPRSHSQSMCHRIYYSLELITKFNLKNKRFYFIH